LTFKLGVIRKSYRGPPIMHIPTISVVVERETLANFQRKIHRTRDKEKSSSLGERVGGGGEEMRPRPGQKGIKRQLRETVFSTIQSSLGRLFRI
jgi:hypothetical protein